MAESIVLRSTLTVWVSARSMNTLHKVSQETGRSVAELCESAIEEACLKAEPSHVMRQRGLDLG